MPALGGRPATLRLTGVLKAIVGVVAAVVAAQLDDHRVGARLRPVSVGDARLRVGHDHRLVSDDAWVAHQVRTPPLIRTVVYVRPALKDHSAFDGGAVEQDLHGELVA